ncbi:MAG: hypothetical protein GY897_02845 [Alteromonas sp.]|nr:hypothetical protein [Alteromonas sp.]
MLVFIRMIPMAVTCDDLYRFIHKGMGSFFTQLLGKKGTVTELSILKFANQEAHSVQYHGLVDIDPVTSAQAAIKRLNQSRLNGVPVEVREFYDRSPSRDRRESQSAVESAAFKDQRRGDRRCNQLNIEPVTVSGFSTGL